jgi:hypothetical protein
MFVSVNWLMAHRASLFSLFSCRDASLRNEGCFFSRAGLPKLASEQAGSGEETKGAALASQQEVLFVFVKRYCVCGVLSSNHGEVFGAPNFTR